MTNRINLITKSVIYKKNLKGELINLRPVQLLDAPNWVKWLKDKEVTQFLSVGPITLEKEKKLLRKMIKSKDQYTFAIETKEGKHIGGCALNNIVKEAKHAEFGIIIGDKASWSKGYGTDALELLLNFGFNRLKLKRIYLRCIEYNKRGIRCYEKCGFVHEGKLRKHMYKKGKPWDEIRMSILINEYNKKYGKRK
ncbi:GNAT family N-acetyltransferase [Patescibacteria group bacterium]|nr:GNAT family N-acetyltransferase [Patescibacteria group bacterium]